MSKALFTFAFFILLISGAKSLRVDVIGLKKEVGSLFYC